MADDPRWPRSVYGVGTEPDPRFSLANERTFLAWIRTSVGLLAAGVVFEVVELPIAGGVRQVLGAVLTLLAAAGAASAWWRWARTERALRRSEPLPAPAFGGVLAMGLLLVAVIVLVGTVWR